MNFSKPRHESYGERQSLGANVSLAIAVMVSLLITPLGFAQQAMSRATGVFNISRMPSELHEQVNAIGVRFTKPGQEQTVLVGEWGDAAGVRQVTLILQLPNLVRIEGLFPAGGVLAFDGVATTGSRGAFDNQILESFAADSVEGLFTAAKQGAAIRLLGRDFGPDPRIAPDFTGPRFDIYELAGRIMTQADKPVRMKRYYFDSESNLLLGTRYQTDAGVTVETRFSSWKVVAGSSYPGKIERYENDQMIFSFHVNTTTVTSKQDASTFRTP